MKQSTYFKVTLLVAPLAVCLYIVAFFTVIINSQEIFQEVENFIASGFIAFLLTCAAIIIYLFWFIIASDEMFKLSHANRVISNILNVLGLIIVPGLSLIATPLYLMILNRTKNSPV